MYIGDCSFKIRVLEGELLSELCNDCLIPTPPPSRPASSPKVFGSSMPSLINEPEKLEFQFKSSSVRNTSQGDISVPKADFVSANVQPLKSPVIASTVNPSPSFLPSVIKSSSVPNPTQTRESKEKSSSLVQGSGGNILDSPLAQFHSPLSPQLHHLKVQSPVLSFFDIGHGNNLFSNQNLPTDIPSRHVNSVDNVDHFPLEQNISLNIPFVDPLESVPPEASFILDDLGNSSPVMCSVKAQSCRMYNHRKHSKFKSLGIYGCSAKAFNVLNSNLGGNQVSKVKSKGKPVKKNKRTKRAVSESISSYDSDIFKSCNAEFWKRYSLSNPDEVAMNMAKHNLAIAKSFNFDFSASDEDALKSHYDVEKENFSQV